MNSMDPRSLSSLFLAHSREQQSRIETILEGFDCDGLIISSGKPFRYFLDDQDAVFRENPHFAHWTPLRGPHHLLYIRQNKKPLLIRVKSKDFWYAEESLSKTFWLDAFEMVEVNDTESAWKEVTSRNTLYVGDDAEGARANGIQSDLIHPPALLEKLNWNRSFKTPYEVLCLGEANRLASLGHRRARDAFLEGKSERDIHYAYLEGAGALERELPYETIVALNHHSATLHYQHKDTRQSDSPAGSLLIDAGARCFGYASDITRTHVTPQVDPLFVDLLEGIEELQQELCREVHVGMSFSELHESAHKKIAELLISLHILTTDTSTVEEKALTKVFFPHGVGHFLGIQVHDVGNARKERGTDADKMRKENNLRSAFVIESGHVFTIEPGVYFIDMLLEPHRTGATSLHFNWELIDRLAPYGGVRIEDDVLVTEDGIRNLTREHL